MDKIIMLGTGSGGTIDLYNTCFVVQNENGNFLVDTGGSVEIIKRLRQVGIDYKNIQHIFISHTHTDHILGLFWLFKKIGAVAMNSKINKINIYCNDVVFECIDEISKRVFPAKLKDLVYKNVNFIILNDGDKYNIYGIDYTFFDLKAKETKQFGFECVLNNKKLAFLGDEPLKPELYEKFRNFDYAMHEAYCLDSEKHIFHPYEKSHSTAKSVSEVMNELKVKNLILYHMEESHGDQRNEMYRKEAQQYFNGNAIVPNDLETIEI